MTIGNSNFRFGYIYIYIYICIILKNSSILNVFSKKNPMKVSSTYLLFSIFSVFFFALCPSVFSQTAVCDNITVTLDGSGMATISASDLDGGSTGMGPLSFSASKTSFGCNDIGANSVTLTVTDTVGSDNCTATVTVEDNTNPSASCIPSTTIYLQADGMVEIDPSDIDDGSSDNCSVGLSNLSVTPSVFTCADIGDNTVVLTVTDDAGNTSSCSSTVSVSPLEIELLTYLFL